MRRRTSIGVGLGLALGLLTFGLFSCQRALSQETAKLSPELEKVYRDGVDELTKNKDYREAAELLGKVVKAIDHRRPVSDPLLSEVYAKLARSQRAAENYLGAAKAFDRSVYYSAENRNKIEEEWRAMADGLLADYGKIVKDKIAKKPQFVALAKEFPLVVLHTRRYAGGYYQRSAYSFSAESSKEEDHGNGVQLLFDNSNVDQQKMDVYGNVILVNNVGNQSNRIVNLGKVDFKNDPDPKKVLPKRWWKRWSSEQVKAAEGEVYLEHCADTTGNDFYVLFQVVAVEPESRYLGFVWRRLPGGTVVKR